ncbi:uncharacterized protein [Haliotis asinina]|uniref:uncharacterized protein n=1 Tax=Haliotis asinina TaxID=109174 RepID=UPI003531D399
MLCDSISESSHIGAFRANVKPTHKDRTYIGKLTYGGGRVVVEGEEEEEEEEGNKCEITYRHVKKPTNTQCSLEIWDAKPIASDWYNCSKSLDQRSVSPNCRKEELQDTFQDKINQYKHEQSKDIESKWKRNGYKELRDGKHTVFVKSYTNSLRWDDALKVCEADGGTLLRIDSKYKETQIGIIFSLVGDDEAEEHNASHSRYIYQDWYQSQQQTAGLAQVYCGQNLALYKPAWMSSLFSGDSVSGAAENSVDGHPGTNWHHGVCSSTADNDRSPWIVIDLLGQYEVHNVTIYNRGDEVPERLHDFVIEIYKTNPSRCSVAPPTVCKAYVGVFGLTGNVQCESAVLGRFVRIWKPTTSHYRDLLTVCEIEVYGIRPANRCPRASTWHRVVRGKYLLSPGAASFPQQSRLTCFLLCVMSDTCVGASYNGGLNECHPISKPMPDDTVSSNEDWFYLGDDLC